MELKQLLKGIKVVELASVLAGPLAGSFLSELGAEVVKIENGPAGGDVTRHWRLPNEKGENNASAYYHSANFGKQVMLLDLKAQSDYESLVSLCKEADVILTNYQKHTAQKLGVDIESLKALNSGAIIVQLNAFDYEDPRPGYDLVMQAESGYISMCGSAMALSKMPVAMIDVLAAHQMKEAVLLGLLQRQRIGQGGVFHVSLFDAALSGLVNQGTNYLMEGHVAEPMGTLHPNIAPYGEILVCADGLKIMLAVGSDGQFLKLADTLGLSEDKKIKYDTNQKRLIGREQLLRDLQLLAVSWTGDKLTSKLEESQVPFARVKNLKEVLTEPQSQRMILDNPIVGRKEGKYISNIAFQAEF